MMSHFICFVVHNRGKGLVENTTILERYIYYHFFEIEIFVAKNYPKKKRIKERFKKKVKSEFETVN